MTPTAVCVKVFCCSNVVNLTNHRLDWNNNIVRATIVTEASVGAINAGIARCPTLGTKTLVTDPACLVEDPGVCSVRYLFHKPPSVSSTSRP